MNEITTWFGLKRIPFDKEIKSSNLIHTQPFKEALARLDYIKRRQGGILLLTGDPGVGKTVAIRCFVDSLNDNLFKAIYTPLSTLRATDLLRHLNDKLGLANRASKAIAFKQLQQELLDSREQRGKIIILVIDEAHLLPTPSFQELRLLTNFKIDSFDPFILILAGQSALGRIMDYSIMEPLAQRISMRYHIPPLSLQETGQYIQNRMKLAGATEPIFAQDALQAIYDASFGIPRRIGQIANQTLTYAMFDSKRTVNADIVLKIKSGG